MEKRKNKISFFIIFIFIFCILLLLISLYLNSIILLDKKEILTTLKIGDVAGFDVNKTALTFGTITPGTNAKRNLTIENTYDFPVKFEFKVRGNIEKFLAFKKEVHLEPGEKKHVEFLTINPLKEDYGDYSGNIVVLIKRCF